MSRPLSSFEQQELFFEARDRYPVLEYRFPVLEHGLGLHTLNSISQEAQSRLAGTDVAFDAPVRMAISANNAATRLVELGEDLFAAAPAHVLTQEPLDLATAPLLKSLLQQLPGTVLTRLGMARTYAGGHLAMHYELFSLMDPETLMEHAIGVVLHYGNGEFVGGMRVHNQAVHLTPEGDRRELSFVEHYYLSSAVPHAIDVDFRMVQDHLQEFLDAHVVEDDSPYGAPDPAAVPAGVAPVDLGGTATGRFDASRPNPAR